MNRIMAAMAAGAFLAAGADGAAHAAVKVNTDFSFDNTDIVPDADNIADATSISFATITLADIVSDNTGLQLFITPLSLTNPVSVGLGDPLTLGWTTATGAFTAALTETKITSIPNSLLTIVATGALSGPAGFSGSSSELTLTFREADVGAYGMSGAMMTVPEPPTWALLLAGFAGLGLGWSNRLRKTARSLAAT
jgi:PEP-CTERM motif